MALNFGLLNTNLPSEIAGSVQRGQDEALRNQMAQQQLKTSAMQQESAQMQLEQAKRERDSLAKLQATFVANGKSPDMRANFQEMMQSGIPQFMDIGLKGMQALERQANVSRILGGMPTGAPAPAEAPAAAPVQSMMRQPAPAPAPMPAQNALGTGMYGMEPAAPVNALAARPSGAYTPVMPRNALAAPTGAPVMSDIENTYRKIDQLHAIGEHELAKSLEQRVKDKLPPTAVQEFEYAKKNGFAGTFEQFKTLQAPRTTVNVPVNVSTEKKYGERFGGLIADADAAKLSAAESAPAAAANADRIIDLISTGKIITGTGANVRLQMAKALNLAGGNDSEKVRNTEVLISSLAETTLGAIKSSNLGAGQGFTNADRDFLEKAKAGQLTYDAKSLTELARLARLAAEKSAESWNTRVKKIPASALEGTGISTEPVIVPPRKVSSVMNIPAGAIEMLKNGTGTREQFDAQFGPGSADRVLPKGK
jgi:hypothetical protein